MKRNWKGLLGLILVLAVACSSSVYAGGLSGIDFGNDEYTGSDEKSLPDPYEILGDYGVLNQEDYEYEEGYICDVYLYSLPDDLKTFADSYQELAESEGYTTGWATMDGCDTCQISDGDFYAYLMFVTDESSMVLLVQDGMAFQLMDESTVPNSDETEDSNTMIVTIDGEKVTFYLKEAYIYDEASWIIAWYYAFNPRGEVSYSMCLAFSTQIKTGTYKVDEDCDYYISFCLNDYGVSRYYKENTILDGTGNLTLEITEISDDWMEYKGKFEGEACDDEGKISVACDEFIFTIGETLELPYDIS